MTLRDPSKERAIKRGERKERKKRFGSGGIRGDWCLKPAP